jgi:NAD(P)-dependent dehydrogenase (short-subunit alcohol dehydrogenase family)
MKVKDKVFVVTGGGSGVGRELVSELLLGGAHVAAVDINEQALAQTLQRAEAYRDKLSAHLVNVADADAVQALPGQVIAQHGAVDAVINNAGIIHPFLALNDMGYDTIQTVMGVNFGGTLNMTKAFLPYLLDRPQASITNISSMGALFPVPGQILYGASKAAVKLLTENLRFELNKTNVKVIAVFPGGMDTNILGHSGVEISRRMQLVRKAFKLLTPEKAAKSIIRGIEKNRGRLTLGFDSAAVDLLCRMSPSLAPQLIYKIMKAIVIE